MIPAIASRKYVVAGVDLVVVVVVVAVERVVDAAVASSCRALAGSGGCWVWESKLE